jgi:hypothetical protein
VHTVLFIAVVRVVQCKLVPILSTLVPVPTSVGYGLVPAGTCCVALEPPSQELPKDLRLEIKSISSQNHSNPLGTGDISSTKSQSNPLLGWRSPCVLAPTFREISISCGMKCVPYSCGTRSLKVVCICACMQLDCLSVDRLSVD